MLKAIRLKDCQSWEDTTIDLSTEKPNILIADNNVGKSVVFKMLKITVFPKIYTAEERRDLIRYDAECAILTCLFDDDAIGMTLVFRDRVLYRFKRVEDTGFVTYSEFPEIYREHLSIIKSDKSNNFIVNIIDTDQDINLVNTKSAGNVEILKLLAEEPTLSEVLIKINNATVPLKETEKQLRIQKINLEHSLEGYTYTDVDALEADISKGDQLLKILEILLKLYDLIDKISGYITDYCDYGSLLQMIEIMQRLQLVYEKLPSCNFDDTDYKYIIATVETLSVLFNISEKLNKVEYESLDLDSIALVLETLQINCDLSQKLQTLTEVQQRLLTSSAEAQEIKKQIDNSGFVIQCPIKGEVLYLNDKCLPYSD